MISVTLCFTTTKVQLLWAILVILLVLAGLGFMVKKAKEKSKRNHRILKSPSAVNLLLTTPQDVQYQEDWQSKEVMSQYREFILDLQPAIVYTCHKLQTVYKILFWSNIYLSLLFYLGTMLAVLNLYLFPTFWTAAAAVNIVFFANGQFINIFKSLLKRISNRFQTRKLSEQCKKRDMNSKVEMPRLQVNEIMTIDSNTDKLVSDMTSTGAASDPEGDGSDVEQVKKQNP
uniref:Protrudin-like n=1 Tax=Saccoglossus kowalevskii TaxID=10224 RepID=A0ABM0N108_SACKO|nr:PREDICTED: protrudin-like [Saccoglossus kowalevskii]